MSWLSDAWSGVSTWKGWDYLQHVLPEEQKAPSVLVIWNAGCNSGVIGAPASFGSADILQEVVEENQEMLEAERACANLDSYGSSYTRTCQYLASQCTEARDRGVPLEIDLPGGTKFSASSYENCLEESRKSPVEDGPLRAMSIPKRYRPWSHALYRERCLEERDFLKPADGYEETAKKLLAARGLLKGEETASDAVSGRVLDAFASADGDDELLIIYGDVHLGGEILRQNTAAVMKLQERGLRIMGTEGASPLDTVSVVMDDLPRETCDILAQTSLTHYLISLSCWMSGREGRVLGTEDMSLHGEQVRLLNLVEDKSNKDGCEKVRAIVDTQDLSIQRSIAMIRNLRSSMKEQKVATGVQIVGYAHLRDMQIYLRQQRVSYVMVGVPAVENANNVVVEAEKRNNRKICRDNIDMISRNCFD